MAYDGYYTTGKYFYNKVRSCKKVFKLKSEMMGLQIC